MRLDYCRMEKILIPSDTLIVRLQSCETCFWTFRFFFLYPKTIFSPRSERFRVDLDRRENDFFFFKSQVRLDVTFLIIQFVFRNTELRQDDHIWYSWSEYSSVC